MKLSQSVLSCANNEAIGERQFTESHRRMLRKAAEALARYEELQCKFCGVADKLSVTCKDCNERARW